MSNQRCITLPAGFVAAAVRAGIKSAGEDVAVIAAVDAPANGAVLTTTNQVIGAPVAWCRKALPKGHGPVRAIAVNSGCSNVCNGPRGDRDAETMARLTARALGAEASEVLVCSTGVIGQPLPMDKVRDGISRCAKGLGTESDEAVARAILTTDLVTKTASTTVTLHGQKATVAGVAKGSGMIAPSLATMFGFITTDANITSAALRRALIASAHPTFHAVTVDNDTSTSDTVAALASGAAGGRKISGGKQFDAFAAALADVCGQLAEAIARDGEGATKLIRIAVRHAADDRDAAAMAKTIAGSPLVKSAAHGGDPNWGRILMAAGRSPGRIDQARAICKIGGHTVFRRGKGTPFDVGAVEAHLAGDEVLIELDLRLGDGAYTALTCDLSREYVAINADYHT